jgi:zinc D-Ala-D-Ala carboxypeptidase
VITIPPAQPDAAPPVVILDASIEPRTVEKGLCAQVTRQGHYAQFVAWRDMTTSFLTGDDLLTLVNRSPRGTLAPDYAPSDLVRVRTLEPASAEECAHRYGCLRKDAAEAMNALLGEMKTHGWQGRVDSAYRSYANQCATFVKWADKPESSFCNATEQSALPGHSQHQLGTTVDMWTEEWAAGDGGIFRDGYGCTSAGRWLADNAWRHGWVHPYPIHPVDQGSDRCAARWDGPPVPINPRTGYKHEAWHLRFIGKENAARFHEAWLASGKDEITLEQWLRKEKGLKGDADLPVCDGCSCGACATLKPNDDKPAPCKDASLWLDDRGEPIAPDKAPEILDVKVTRKDKIVLLEIKVSAAPHTITQTPVLTEAFVLSEHERWDSLPFYRKTIEHRFEDLPGAWRIGVEPSGEPPSWPWRVSLARSTVGKVYNRANLYLPAAPGESVVKLSIRHDRATALRVTLLKDGAEHGTREVPLPK